MSNCEVCKKLTPANKLFKCAKCPNKKHCFGCIKAHKRKDPTEKGPQSVSAIKKEMRNIEKIRTMTKSQPEQLIKYIRELEHKSEQVSKEVSKTLEILNQQKAIVDADTKNNRRGRVDTRVCDAARTIVKIACIERAIFFLHYLKTRIEKKSI